MEEIRHLCPIDLTFPGHRTGNSGPQAVEPAIRLQWSGEKMGLDVQRCLQRIDYRGPTDTTLVALRSLQRAFLLRVPFENLDIHLGREISFSPDAVYQKIVLEQRGGFCYECNGLFHDLLLALEFQVVFLSARMVLDSTPGPEFDHMVLLVSLEQDYLVDVGNGRSCREPMALDEANQSISEGIRYQIQPHGDDLALFYREPDAPWAPRFLFSLRPRQRTEFQEMCGYHQTSPDSPFARKRLVTLATPDGRITLSGKRFTLLEGSRRQEREVNSEPEYTRCLADYFGITSRTSPPGQGP